jgi:hypothetical protein
MAREGSLERRFPLEPKHPRQSYRTARVSTS